jgi:hypothetical protein
VSELTSIDIINDESLRGRVWALSLAPLVLGAVAAVLLGVSGLGEKPSLLWFVALVTLFAASLPVHELVHAAAFKLLVPGCHITFEAMAGMLATNANGAVMTRKASYVVFLAPLVLVSATLGIVPAAFGCPVMAVIEVFMHLGGCAGDVLMVCEVAREKACTHVRDTDCGIDLLAE